MTNILKKIKANALLSAILYTIFGLVLLIWPGTSAQVLTTALGMILVLCGLGNIGDYVFHRDGSLYSVLRLISGIVLAVIGLWLTTQPNLLTVVVPRVMGVLICFHGFSDLGSALTLRKKSALRWPMALLLAVITLALGLLLIYNPFSVFATVVRIIGAILLFDGISDIWIALQVHQASKPSLDETNTSSATSAGAPADAVDAEFKDVPDEP